ncbi:MAG TPA: hypothetical protein VHU85_17570 [Acidimicrobiales bacterium]|jgi:hypothetical protein|nr:hypothetical protein [Acidimicrobiales bacterium]
MIALTLAAGLVGPGEFVALSPSTADATGSDPLGPTVAQLEASYAGAVASAQSTSNYLVGTLPSVLECDITEMLGMSLLGQGCAAPGGGLLGSIPLP